MGIAVVGCAPEKTSLFNPDFEFPKESPIISEILPARGYLAGVNEITVNGQYFSGSSDSVKIYFNGVEGKVNTYGMNSLRVTSVADVIGDTVQVVVSTIGSEFFSNTFKYKLLSPTPDNDILDTGEKLYAPFYDADGNIIYYSSLDNTPRGFVKVDKTTKQKSMFFTLPSNQSFDKFVSAFVGPDGVLHGLRVNQTLTYKVNPATESRFGVGFRMPSGVQTSDLLYLNNFVWVAGTNRHIMRFDYNNPTTRVDYTLVDSVSYRKIYHRGDKFYLIGKTTTVLPGYEFIATVDIDGANEISNFQELYTISETQVETSGEIAGLFIDENDQIYVSLSNEPLKKLVNGSLETFYNGLVGKNITSVLWTDSTRVYTLTEPSGVPAGNSVEYAFKQLDMYNLKQYK
ncbi:hypothetical protein EP331_13700 [bacterium]|nr:MAG: hypothetical protein EP331_13700 [bacterium]